MNTYISLLRGINVGGHNKIPMVALAQLYDALGVTNVKTYIQSGNVIFDSPSNNISELTTRITTEIKTSFNFDVAVFLRTPTQWQTIIADNPFLNQDPSQCYVAFLSEIPTDPPLTEIIKAKDTAEQLVIRGQEIYLYYPNGAARTKLSNTFLEKKLKVAATMRNWNTVTKLGILI